MTTPLVKETQMLTCRNCGSLLSSGNYCAECGEKRHAENDKSLKHLAEETFHFFTHFEGKFFTTIKTMFASPGKVSRDFVSGVKKKYFKPVSLYLLIVIVYLLFPVFGGLNMKLEYHYKSAWYGDYAVRKAEQVKLKNSFSDERLEEVFHAKGEKTSKFLLLIVIPVMACVSLLFGFRKTSYYYDHFIFAAEVSSFYLLFGYLILPLILWMLYSAGMSPFSSENPVALFMYGVTGLYAGIASARFFGFRWWVATIFAIAFSVSLTLFISHAYKFLLFNIVMSLL
jgi:hypothetical protein